MESEDTRSKSQLGTENIGPSVQAEERRSGGLSGVLNFNVIEEQNSGERTRMDVASPMALNNLHRWDSDEKIGHGTKSESGTRDKQMVTRKDLVKELFKGNQDIQSRVGKLSGPNEENL